MRVQALPVGHLTVKMEMPMTDSPNIKEGKCARIKPKKEAVSTNTEKYILSL
jgi:hypothetical protein